MNTIKEADRPAVEAMKRKQRWQIAILISCLLIAGFTWGFVRGWLTSDRSAPQEPHSQVTVQAPAVQAAPVSTIPPGAGIDQNTGKPIVFINPETGQKEMLVNGKAVAVN